MKTNSLTSVFTMLLLYPQKKVNLVTTTVFRKRSRNYIIINPNIDPKEKKMYEIELV